MQESEAEMKLEKAQELAKAELNAAIANEKATQIEKMAEANINVRLMINLGMAGYNYILTSHSLTRISFIFY